MVFKLCARWTTIIWIVRCWRRIPSIIPTLTVFSKGCKLISQWFTNRAIRPIIMPAILGCVFPLIAWIIVKVMIMEDSFWCCTSIFKWVVLVKICTRISTIVIPPPRCASPSYIFIFRVSRWVTTQIYTRDNLNGFCPTMCTNFSSTNFTSKGWIRKRIACRRNQHVPGRTGGRHVP